MNFKSITLFGQDLFLGPKSSMLSPNQFQGPYPAQVVIDFFFFLTKIHLCGDHILCPGQ